jgi:hypothetical protein
MPTLDGITFYQISIRDNFILSTTFIPSTVGKVVSLSNGIKPEEKIIYLLQFFKLFWSLLREEVDYPLQ